MTITQELIERLIKESAVIIENDGAVVFQQIHHLIGFIGAYQAAISQHKAVQDVYSHEDIARLLITIGWRCDGDAQWTRIKEAMPRLRTMLAAPSDNKALVESEPVAWSYEVDPRTVEGSPMLVNHAKPLESSEFPIKNLTPLYAINHLIDHK
jgi:hypothetical protein